MIGTDCKLVWAQDEAGEIGKRPALGPDQFEIDGASYVLLAEARQAQTTRRGRR